MKNVRTISEWKLPYCPYASFTNTQLPLLKVAALYLDKLVLLDPFSARWDTVGADHIARDAVKKLHSAGILDMEAAAESLAKYAVPIHKAIHRKHRRLIKHDHPIRRT